MSHSRCSRNLSDGVGRGNSGLRHCVCGSEDGWGAGVGVNVGVGVGVGGRLVDILIVWGWMGRDGC